MKNLIKLSLLLSVLVFSVDAKAQQLEKTYNDWSVFTLQSKGEKMCYIASTPKQKTGNYKKRGEPYLIVTHRSKTVDEVSASSGYPYQKGSTVTLTFDKKIKHDLFTTVEVADVAWARDADEDAKIVANMKKGYDLVVQGKSRLKSNSKDTYSLRGFTLAYKRMKKACK